jgi:hypothetical protein
MAILPSNPQQRQKVLLGLLLIGAAGYGVYNYLYVPPRSAYSRSGWMGFNCRIAPPAR